MNDAEYIARFERLEIPKEEFCHADHIRIAWIYLRSGDFATGASKFVTQFGRYVRTIGADAKYHETITWFFLVKIRERIRSSPAKTWEDFAFTNPDLLDRNMPILKAHYRPETLHTAFARAVFVLPDSAGCGSQQVDR